MIDDDFNCIECASDSYIIHNICCPEGMHYNPSNTNDCTMNTIDDCI